MNAIGQVDIQQSLRGGPELTLAYSAKLTSHGLGPWHYAFQERQGECGAYALEETASGKLGSGHGKCLRPLYPSAKSSLGTRGLRPHAEMAALDQGVNRCA